MPTSIIDMYKSAYKKQVSWNQALLLTGLYYVGEQGLMVSPPPKNKDDYEFYKLRLDILLEYSNDNSSYQEVVKALKEYMNNSYEILQG